MPPNFKFCIVSTSNPEPGAEPLWATHDFTVAPAGPNQEWNSNMGEKGFQMYIPGSKRGLSMQTAPASFASTAVSTSFVHAHEAITEGSVEEIEPSVYILRMATGSPPGIESLLAVEGNKIVVKKFNRGSGGDRPAWKVVPCA